MAQKGFYIDNSRCSGCKTCEIACKDYKDLGADMLFRKIYDYEGGSWSERDDGTWAQDVFMYHLSLSCNHCDAPSCAAACPVSAIAKDEETGIVHVDPEICIGCGSCVSACPYQAPKLDQGLKLSRKCDGCLERIRDGRQAICVEACPIRALDFDDIAALRSRYGALDQIPPLPSPLTAPNLVIKASPAALSQKAAGGFVANELEIA
jgi:anaerobic dimethyl sulfoxide reductase subunit B (iron-sulfur subunit)